MEENIEKDLPPTNRRKGFAVLPTFVGVADRFIPSSVGEAGPNVLRRARLTVAFAMSLMATCLLFGIFHYALDSPICAMTFGLGIGAGFVCLHVMHRTGSCFLTGNLIAALFFGALAVLTCRMGGHGSLTLPWYMAIPVMTLVTAGRRSATVWIVMDSGTFIAFFLLDYLGYALPNDLTPQRYAILEVVSLIGLSLLMLSLALLYEIAKEQALTELGAAETQLLEERNFSDSIIASLPGAFYLFDENGRFLRWNENFELVTGYSPDELSRMQPPDFFCRDDRVPIEERGSAVFAADHSETEAYFISKDESAIPYLLSSKRVVLDGKQHVVGMGVDISERKRIEAALEKRIVALTQPMDDAHGLKLEELFNLDDIQRLQDEFAKATGVASIITGTDGSPITAPTNFCRLCSDIIRKTDKGCRNCMESDAALGRYNPDGPIIRPCLSGGLWEAGTSISVGGKHIASWLIGQVRDDTQTEENIRKYARTIEADEGTVVEAFREVSTMSREQFEWVAQALFTLAQQLSTTAYQNVQQARFITEHKRTGAELAQARDDAEAANQAKSSFLANMSHEIRTPMTAILGFSDILLESEMNREQLDAAATIKRNGEYLIRIINDILDLSKIEAGKMEIDRIPVSPTQILADVVSLMGVRARAKNLPLEVAYDGPMPQTIDSDPIRLRQILINLIGNAIKFTEAGQVRVVARVLDSGSEKPSLQIEVVDSGIGMSEAETARLFRPFGQIDSSTTRQHGGTGLGLAISKRLAQRLGGDIGVKSVLGEGSTFTVTVTTDPLDGVERLPMPTSERPALDSVEASATSQDSIDCRVLLAEDGPDNQRLITYVLKKAGGEVVVAENGQMAFDLAVAAQDAGTPFGVILMDMQMPVMDGYEATARLRKAGYTGPIVAVTAHAMNTDHDKCLRSGCDDYMTKPINRERLISLVAQYASRNEPTSVY